jgi:hypothetical protein
MKISERAKAVLWSVVVMLLLAAPCTADDPFFEDNFDLGIDPDVWSIVSNQPLFTVDNSGGAVLMSKPYGGNGWGHWDYVFLCFAGELTGNFTASVDFSALNVELTDVGCNGISIEPFYGGQIHALVRQDCEDGGDTVGVWLDPPQVWIGRSEDASSGTLRVERIGTLVTSYLDGTPVVHSDNFNGAPVTDLCFGLGNNNSLDAVSVRFDNFKVTAEAIDDPAETWRKVVAASTTGEGRNPALAFHPTQPEAAIAYTDPEIDQLRVVRGAWDGNEWQWAEPEVAAPEGHAVDLEYDACGGLWASFTTKGKMKLARWDGASWSQRLLDRNAISSMTSLAHDPMDTCGSPPSVLYGVDEGNQGHLMFVDGDSPPVVVDTGARSDGRGGVGIFSSLAYRANGDLAAVYSYRDRAMLNWVRFASRDSGGLWHLELENQVGAGYEMLRKMSLVWKGDTPMFAYGNAGTMPLVFCERPDTWSCTVLNPGSSGGWNPGYVSDPTIMVDDQGTVIIGAEISAANFEEQLWLYRRPEGSTDWHVKRVRGFSAADGALDPAGNPAFCDWEGSDLYLAYLDTGGCEWDADCDDANSCTDDWCDAENTCQHDSYDDGTPCGSAMADICCLGQCTPWCDADSDCDDGDECTIDSCSIGTNPPCSSHCEHEPDPDCCIPTHSKEKGPRCSDGLDNDCDGLIDGEDPDC